VRAGFALRAAGAILLITISVSCRKHEASARKISADKPRRVERAFAMLRPMEKALTVTGTLAAQENATLSAKVPGRLDRIAVDLGSVVKRGDLIAQVERSDYELRVKQAQAAVAEARAALGLPLQGTEQNFAVETVATVKQAKAVLEEAANNRERVVRLSKEGISSQSELDTVETTHKVALTRYDSAVEEARTRLAVLAQRRADLEIAEQQLRDSSICAPFDGAIQSRTASPGEFLQLGDPVVSLVRLDPLRLRLEVPERDSIHVQTNQHVRIMVDGNTNVFHGTVARVSPAITEQNRMLIVEADVPAQPGLRPGLFVRANIVVNENERVLSVPANALIVFAGIEKVITIADGKARECAVTTGRRAGNWIEIVSGLKTGDPVVLNPGSLRTGQPVTLADTTAAPAAHTELSSE
jgi:RND family efflux transporter MFP subunit